VANGSTKANARYREFCQLAGGTPASDDYQLWRTAVQRPTADIGILSTRRSETQLVMTINCANGSTKANGRYREFCQTRRSEHPASDDYQLWRTAVQRPTADIGNSSTRRSEHPASDDYQLWRTAVQRPTADIGILSTRRSEHQLGDYSTVANGSTKANGRYRNSVNSPERTPS